MKERTIVSAFALVSSLGAYYYAKQYQKDTTPVVMIGGFLGAMLGEMLSQFTENNKSQKTNSEYKQLKLNKKKSIKNVNRN